MPLLLVRPGGAKRGWLPILMKYYTSKLVQCSQRSNFMMQSFQLLQPILTEKTKIWVCKSILSRGPIIEGGNSIGRGERWLLLPILLKYYIAKAAQQTMQCKVTFVEVVLLPNIKEKQWSGFAQVVFFCHLAEEEEEQCVSLQESFKAKMVANCHDTLLCRQFEW